MKRVLILLFSTLLLLSLQAQTYTTVRLDTLKAKTTGRQTIALGAGLKFPDNTTQQTSASSIAHDTALTLIRHESDPLFKAHPANTISSANILNWNNAFSWGNHASAGYLKSESDPTFVSHPASSISFGNISNWNTAYNWGNHASVGYLKNESDPVFASHPSSTISSGNISNWNTAFSWGNHASGGYLKSESDPIWRTDSSSFASKAYVNGRTGHLGGVTPIDGIFHWDGTAYNPYTSITDGSLKISNSSVVSSFDASGYLNINGQLIAGSSSVNNNRDAVTGRSNSGYGVFGWSVENYGVYGLSNSYPGMYGRSFLSSGVFGYSTYKSGLNGYSILDNGVYASSRTNVSGVFNNEAGNTSNILEGKLNSVTMFSVDKSGNLNIPAGSSYKVNGVPIATGGGNSDVSKTLRNYHSTDTAAVIWTEGDNVPGSYIYTGGQGSVPLILETEVSDVSLIVKSQLSTVLKVTRSEGIVVPSIKGDKSAAPGASPTSNAGTGAYAYVAPWSTNLAGQVTLGMGSDMISTGRQVYVNFDGSFPTAPFVFLTPANSMTATNIISNGFYVESDTNGFWITNDNYDPIAVYAYVERKWNYMIIQ